MDFVQNHKKRTLTKSLLAKENSYDRANGMARQYTHAQETEKEMLALKAAGKQTEKQQRKWASKTTSTCVIPCFSTSGAFLSCLFPLVHCKVGETAKKACRHDFISALPDGYNSVIGEGGTLSGGEKHRFFMQQLIEADVPPDIAA
ncbi:MAG TPA: hypothetical protein DEF06_05225 [Clostridiales bacterium]|jgi:ABC transporter, permease/ATP-binding protein|nr:hypothetical protein [Clostridiales bacterium]